jgi:hypothetical protein
MRCRGRQMQLSFIHDPAVFDLDIPRAEPCYDLDINLEEHGFFNWIDEIDHHKMGILIKRHWNKAFGANRVKEQIVKSIAVPESDSVGKMIVATDPDSFGLSESIESLI